tara:strand:+ start:5584 stop:6270 length:687 start_codon:yes stop_codon:yes gene_type:complete
MTKKLATESTFAPYYEDDYCTIYHGDCRDVLPTLSVADLVIADPPYGIGESNEKNKTRSSLAPTTDFGTYTWDRRRCPDLVELAVRHGKEAIVFGGNYYTDVLPPSSSWIVWDKDNGKNDFADCELAWTSHKRAVRKFKWRWQGMLQERGGRDKEKRQHPTQKPLPLLQWIITTYAEKGDILLDPFMGSGTTLEAAKRCGYRAIGIEQELSYCDVAVSRLLQGVFNFD